MARKQKINKALKNARLEKGLTLIEASELFGIHKDTLFNYENGKTSPTFSFLKKAKILYGILLDELD